jgi:hypothetical protein
MSIEPARFRCFRCAVSYRIEQPDPRAERLMCAECMMRFWSAKSGNVVQVGIYPAELVA